MNKILMEDGSGYIEKSSLTLNSEHGHAREKLYYFQDADGVLKPVKFQADAEPPMRQNLIAENGGEFVFSNETEQAGTANMQLLGSGTQNILVAQSITNLIPINQNVRLYTLNEGSTAKVCQPILLNKRLISLPSQNVPIFGQLVDAGDSGLLKIITTDSLEQTVELSNVLTQSKRKIMIENKPDLILNVDNAKPAKSKLGIQLLKASQGNRDISQKIKLIEATAEEIKKVTNQCKDASRRSTFAIAQKKEQHTTVHLLQNGQEFHSIDQLDEDKLRLVTGALNRVANRSKVPNNTVMYDPTSKTKIIYRVVYPEDLNLCSNSSATGQSTKPATKRAPSQQTKEVAAPTTPKIMSITRSGRVVKLPRHINNDLYEPLSPQSMLKSTSQLPKESATLTKSTPQRAKRKCGLSRHECPTCLKIFRGYKRIGQHYAEFPDHKVTKSNPSDATASSATAIAALPTVSPDETPLPTLNGGTIVPEPKIASKMSGNNLFECLTSMLDSTEEAVQASTFAEELELFVLKLRGLVPCILKPKEDTSKEQCNVSEIVGRILDISPGQHKIDINALKCSDSTGACAHRTIRSTAPESVWFPKEFGTNPQTPKLQQECARTDSFEKWFVRKSQNPQKPQMEQTKVCWSTPNLGNLPTAAEKTNGLEKSSFSETWMQDSNMSKLEPLTTGISESFLNNLDRQFVYVNSNMNMPMDIDNKTHIDCNDIDSSFIDDSALNGHHDLNLERQALPSFIKINGSGRLHLTSLQSSSLNDIATSQISHSHTNIATTGSHMTNPTSNEVLNSIINGSREAVSLETNDNACDERPMSMNESSLSANQSVLQLLDPLGSDCLSFSDSELRPSLDLPLDLFQFHHT